MWDALRRWTERRRAASSSTTGRTLARVDVRFLSRTSKMNWSEGDVTTDCARSKDVGWTPSWAWRAAKMDPPDEEGTSECVAGLW